MAKKVSLLVTSVVVLAEILVESPRKAFIFIINKCIYEVKISLKTSNLLLEKNASPMTGDETGDYDGAVCAGSNWYRTNVYFPN